MLAGPSGLVSSTAIIAIRPPDQPKTAGVADRSARSDHVSEVMPSGSRIPRS